MTNETEPIIESNLAPNKNIVLAPGAIPQDTLLISHQPNTVIPKHYDAEKKVFVNPYIPIRNPPMLDQVRIYSEILLARNFIPNNHQLPLVQSNLQAIYNPFYQNVQYTWIGHSSFLIQVGGYNILADPVFRKRCSFFQHLIGPKRIRPIPFTIEQLPPIDVIVISHNHTDHLDLASLKKIVHTNKNNVKFYVPLRMKKWLEKKIHDLVPEQVMEMDWWQVLPHISNPGYGVDRIQGSLEVTFLPSQHWSVRNLLDTNKQLWGGFGFRYIPFNQAEKSRTIYFAGDTGYNNHFFREIKSRFADVNGGIDTAFIPIGAYGPRWFSASQHTDPIEAVQIAKDIGARHSCGMHFGTFIVASEPVLEPIEKLHQALQLIKMDYHQGRHDPEGDSFFITVAHGETYLCRHKLIKDHVDIMDGPDKDQNTMLIEQMENEK